MNTLHEEMKILTGFFDYPVLSSLNIELFDKKIRSNLF